VVESPNRETEGRDSPFRALGSLRVRSYPVSAPSALPVNLTTVMQNPGRSNVHLGQYERARTLVHQEIRLLQEQGWQRDVASHLDLMGMLALPRRAYDEAYRWLQQSLSAFQEFGLRLFLPNAEAVTGYAARGIGRPDQAREHLAEALRLGREQEAWRAIALALPAIALLLADQGETERAVELYALASTFPYVANSRWFEDVAGREIDALAATLPPEVAAVAQERGRARDLGATMEELLAELNKDLTGFQPTRCRQPVRSL
jgi:tetratricopeptide (TPR) repeat protein